MENMELRHMLDYALRAKIVKKVPSHKETAAYSVLESATEHIE